MPSLGTSPLYRDKQAAEFFGVSRETIWRWARTIPEFPKPVKVGPNVTGWPLDSLVAYRDGKLAENEAA
jgi:predicted DNA-binding transcriptional regulator AlpA